MFGTYYLSGRHSFISAVVVVVVVASSWPCVVVCFVPKLVVRATVAASRHVRPNLEIVLVVFAWLVGVAGFVSGRFARVTQSIAPTTTTTTTILEASSLLVRPRAWLFPLLLLLLLLTGWRIRVSVEAMR